MSIYRKSPYVEQQRESKTFTAGIDVMRQYNHEEPQWHLAAIEFHHKDAAQAVKLRDKVFDMLERDSG